MDAWSDGDSEQGATPGGPSATLRAGTQETGRTDMKHRRRSGITAGAVAAVVTCVGISCAALAAGYDAARWDPDKATWMAADALFVRPISLVATLAGGVVWLVSSPFHVLGGNSDEAARVLIEEPGAYTFRRRLGDFRHCQQYGAGDCPEP